MYVALPFGIASKHRHYIGLNTASMWLSPFGSEGWPRKHRRYIGLNTANLQLSPVVVRVGRVNIYWLK